MIFHDPWQLFKSKFPHITLLYAYNVQWDFVYTVPSLATCTHSVNTNVFLLLEVTSEINNFKLGPLLWLKCNIHVWLQSIRHLLFAVAFRITLSDVSNTSTWIRFQNWTILRHLGHGKLEVYYMQSKSSTDYLTKFTFLPSEDYIGIWTRDHRGHVRPPLIFPCKTFNDKNVLVLWKLGHKMCIFNKFLIADYE